MVDIRVEIESESIALQRRGQRNYIIQYILVVVTIFSSFLASLSVALDWFGKDILAVLSALPAAILAATSRLNLEAKVKWYFEKRYELRAILSAIDNEGLSIADASKKRTAIDGNYEPKWPGFGQAPK